jgi:hypothetical protein
LGFLAGMRVTQSTLTQAVNTNYQLNATAKHGKIGHSENSNVTVSRTKQQIGVNMLTGIVTAINDSVAQNTGDWLYSVNNSKLYLVQGGMPFYRPLTGGETGADVNQICQMLASWQLLAPVQECTFNSTVANALKTWQARVGEPQTGVVDYTKFIAVSELPATVFLDDSIRVGNLISSGSGDIFASFGAPNFYIDNISPDKALTIPKGATVEIPYGDNKFTGKIGNFLKSDMGSTKLIIEPTEGDSVCGSKCDEINGQDGEAIYSNIIIVPEIEGVIIPQTAVNAENGKTFVVLSSGEKVDVKVLGSSGGISVVEGLNEGQEVRLGN